MNVCLYGASSTEIGEPYITATETLGEMLACRGHSLVYGAGGAGLMGAAARGMKRGGGYVVGVVPSFLKVDGVLFDGCDEMIFTDTMRERKQIMEERADAFVVTPGGIGTFEEFFEDLLENESDKPKEIELHPLEESEIKSILKDIANEKTFSLSFQPVTAVLLPTTTISSLVTAKPLKSVGTRPPDFVITGIKISIIERIINGFNFLI